MKTKLLRKAKSRLKLYKRGNLYRVYLVDSDFYSSEYTLKDAEKYYRIWVIRRAREIFGYKPKKTLR